MRNSFTIWTIGLMLAAFVVGGMQSCGKEDMPEPPKQEEPTTPDNPDTPDPPREPFDPTKPYKPKNKLLQVFKHWYPKYVSSSDGITPQGTGGTEYVVDDNNNLVQIRGKKSGTVSAEFEYGYFTDQMGNIYQVKLTEHNNNSFGIYDEISLCKLNEDEMVVDQYDPTEQVGHFYEYENNHIVKVSYYRVVAGRKIIDRITGEYVWASNTLMAFKEWLDKDRVKVDEFKYPAPDMLIKNQGALFTIYGNPGYGGIDSYLYMAALMGEPSEYLPLSYFDYNINEIKFDSNGLPVNVVLSCDYYGISYYNKQYEWRELKRK